MTHAVQLTKDKHYGNMATTTVSLGPVEFVEFGQTLLGERIPRIKTRKNSNRGVISSFASVSVLKDSGRGYRTETTIICGDYTSRPGIESRATATAKEVARVHAVALLDLPAILDSVNAFYATRAVA